VSANDRIANRVADSVHLLDDSAIARVPAEFPGLKIEPEQTPQSKRQALMLIRLRKINRANARRLC